MQAATPDEEGQLLAEAPEQVQASTLPGRRTGAFAIACLTACLAGAALVASTRRSGTASHFHSQLQAWWDDGEPVAGDDSQEEVRYDPTDDIPGAAAAVGSSSCEVMWNLRVADMISQGWGSRVLYAAAMYQRFHDWAGCTFYTAEAIAEEWRSRGLESPFQTVDPGTWRSMCLDASLQDVDSAFMVRMRGSGPADSMGQWSGQPATKSLVFSDWAGCFPEYDAVMMGMFRGFLDGPKAMSGSYIGIHVRHGDKINEGPISSLQETMSMVTSSGSALTDVWLATDDSSLLDMTSDYQGYTFSSATYSRQSGGESATSDGLFNHHDSGNEAADAVMADTLQLAQASVLIGNWNSNFFRIAWMLNYLRRSEAERAEDWCYDVLTGLPCNDRQSFVQEWVEQASRMGLPEGALPSASAVQSCSRPM